VLLSVALVVSACSSGESPVGVNLQESLLHSTDLPPGSWHPYAVGTSAAGDNGAGLCGATTSEAVPQPVATAKAAFAIDDKVGPILGLRNEQYRSGQAKQRLAASQRRSTPCTWTEGTASWRLVRVDIAHPPTSDIAVFAITSASGGIATTYEIVMRRGDILLLASLATHTPDEKAVADLTERMWSRATTQLSGEQSTPDGSPS
jgi:hypothetical protein